MDSYNLTESSLRKPLTEKRTVATDWSKVNYKKRKRDFLRNLKNDGDVAFFVNLRDDVSIEKECQPAETPSATTSRDENAEIDNVEPPTAKNSTNCSYGAFGDESSSTYTAVMEFNEENIEEISNIENLGIKETNFTRRGMISDDDAECGSSMMNSYVDSVAERTYSSSEENASSGAEIGGLMDSPIRVSDNDSLDGNETEDANTFTINDKIDRLSVPMRLRQGVTVLFAILQVIAAAIRAQWTYMSIILVFKLLKTMTVDNELPSTIKSLWKLLSRKDNAASNRHLYCRKCLKYLGNRPKPAKNCSCGRCGPMKNNKWLSYFIEVKVQPQLEQLFADKAIVKSLQYRFVRTKQEQRNTEDIFDATGYKKLCLPGGILSNKYNFSFSLFTDGFKVTNSSSASAWPIRLVINEFPPHARKKYMILAGIWVDTKHPNLHTLLKPTVMELRSLYDIGIQWTNTIENRTITSKFVTIICTADSKARAPLLAMTQGNGQYGCTYCYHKGQQLEGAVVSRVYPNETVPSARRTDEEIRRHMITARNERRRVYGVKNVATIALLPEFDLGSGAPVDSMHNVYLGVAKFHTELMLKGKATDAWYAGNPRNIATINARLLKIRPPSQISRKPRPVEEMRQWKASEWRNWLQFYAVPCLRGIIRPNYLRHMMLLSRAAYMLNKNSISPRELQTARTLLTQYVKEFETLFGKKTCDSVTEWGPFWTHSAFPYEAFNKKIIDKVTSATGRCLQIVTRYLLTRFIENVLSNERLSYHAKESINKILTNGLKKRNYVIDSTPLKSPIFEGKNSFKRCAPTDEDSRIFSRANYQRPNVISFYRQAIIKGATTYACEPKKINRRTRYCNKYVYCEAVGYGEIKKVITFLDKDSEVNGFIIEKLVTLRNYLGIEHIQVVSRGRKQFLLCDDNLLMIPALAIEIMEQQLIITKLPNVWESD